MKFSHYFLTLCFTFFLNSSVIGAGLTPIGVTEPDLPDNGWYWAGASGGVSGWGLNIETQDASFSSTNQFMFGAMYTYDETGVPVWYTFGGEYVANVDVSAWRDSLGDMGSITASLRKTSGGGCFDCTQSEPSSQEQDTITITWSNPLDARITLSSGNSQEVSRMIWHNGIGAQDIDFITNGAWEILWQDVPFVEIPDSNYVTSLKGIIKFEKVVEHSQELQSSVFYDENSLYYKARADTAVNFCVNPFRSLCNLELAIGVMIKYDPITRVSTLFQYFTNKPYEGCVFSTAGYLRTSSSTPSIFYGQNDSNCRKSDYAVEENRGLVFATLSRVGTASQAVLNNRYFTLEQLLN